MFLAVGSGAYVAAIFHMVTHAFFKALLFLGAGLGDPRHARRAGHAPDGALRKLMPITAVTFIIGWLAIAGVPPFAGFWSKDEILLYALVESPALYVVGLVTALLTAYYMTRQVIMVFFGEAHWKDHAEEHGAHGEIKPHESPWIMLFPLVVLAGLSIVGGVIQLPVRRRVAPSSRAGWSRWSSSVSGTSRARGPTTTSTCCWPSPPSPRSPASWSAWLVYQKRRVKAVEPTILANALVLRPGRHRLHGRPGP